MDAYTHDGGESGRQRSMRDEYDDDAIQIIAHRDGNALATARVLLDTFHFEIEQDEPMTDYREKGRCAEVSRLAVVPSARHSLVLVALFRAFFQVWLREEVRYVFCGVTTDCAAAKMYESMGFTRMPGLHHKLCYKKDFCIMVIDVQESMDVWRLKRPAMLQYILQPIEKYG
ncbi:MAG: hypothetical protein WC824_02910 [Bacteroidota bacterium]